ncbi:FixH family protein [Sinorhizobium alkalisoli]|uniref:FixH family protein n=1 Tax=Sinorhizobium alkalisoli TaxID=1752398 RepID=UPI00124D4FED|nr:FixH family protein [Sinorhizobium alkalisoli]MCG5479700.1 FixH family protein [Sinorhizobium alkalisoli]QFI68674.1 Capsular polysaccharide biosynthesis/export periplasmic protein WcbA [Sinorhizobium alkalisoli]
MNNFSPKGILASLAIVLASTTASYAEATDYEFQLVQPEVAQGPEATVAVRLIDKRTEKPVSNAVIFTTRMDMAPEGMEAMTTPVEALPSMEPGIYRFKTNLSMEGGWRFKLAAKVQGETDTVQGEVILQATP